MVWAQRYFWVTERKESASGLSDYSVCCQVACSYLKKRFLKHAFVRQQPPGRKCSRNSTSSTDHLMLNSKSESVFTDLDYLDFWNILIKIPDSQYDSQVHQCRCLKIRMFFGRYLALIKQLHPYSLQMKVLTKLALADNLVSHSVIQIWSLLDQKIPQMCHQCEITIGMCIHVVYGLHFPLIFFIPWLLHRG